MRIDPRLVVSAAAVAGLAVGQAGWWRATTTGITGTLNDVEISGAAGTGGLAAALPGVALSAVLATLMLGRVGTRVMAGAAAAAGLGMAILGLSAPLPVAEAVIASNQVGISVMSEPVSTLWPVGFGVAGVGVCVAAAWLMWRPPRGGRPASRRASEMTDPLAAWKAMDAGEDPTTNDADRGADVTGREGELT